MSTYTVIRNSDLKNTAQVVVEYDVPATGTNNAGIQWRDIVADLRDYNLETGTTVNPTKRNDTVYVGLLDTGAKLEVSLTVEYTANLNNAQKAAVIDAAVAAKIADYAVEFQNVYEFYGTERTV